MSLLALVSTILVFVTIFYGILLQSEHQPTIVNKHSLLVDHSKNFKRDIVKIEDGIYVAIGYGLANSIFLVGNNEVTQIDTLESNVIAQTLYKDIKHIIQNKPINTIIYTHYHPDHIFGTSVFMNNNTQIISHKLTPQYMDELLSFVQVRTYRGSMKQFGPYVDQDNFINSGIGPSLNYGRDQEFSIVKPTRTFDNELELKIDNFELKLYHTPGESDDQINIMINNKILVIADNYYWSFPNLDPIRGVKSRDVNEWVLSLIKMRELRPSVLIPCHTSPVFGTDNIYVVLKNYGAAIKFVHDQTVKCMNEGLTLDEIVKKVVLPDYLKDLPYLTEFYGKVEWSVKGIVGHYTNWFSGEAVDLKTNDRNIDLILYLVDDNMEILKKKVTELYEKERYQDALYLITALEKKKIKLNDIKISILDKLAEEEYNANARNWYLSEKYELQTGIIKPGLVEQRGTLNNATIENVMRLMTVRLDAKKSLNYQEGINFRFVDSSNNIISELSLEIDRGVCYFHDHLINNFYTLTINKETWIKIITKEINPLITMISGFSSNNLFVLNKFFGMFDTNV